MLWNGGVLDAGPSRLCQFGKLLGIASIPRSRIQNRLKPCLRRHLLIGCGRNTEPRRHRQPRTSHLTQVSPLAAYQRQHITMNSRKWQHYTHSTDRFTALLFLLLEIHDVPSFFLLVASTRSTGVNPYHQTTPEVNTVSLDNTQLQTQLEAHTPGWNATVLYCRHRR